jgi:hypothetical protein
MWRTTSTFAYLPTEAIMASYRQEAVDADGALCFPTVQLVQIYPVHVSQLDHVSPATCRLAAGAWMVGLVTQSATFSRAVRCYIESPSTLLNLYGGFSGQLKQKAIAFVLSDPVWI